MDGHPLCAGFPHLITLKPLYCAHLKVMAFVLVFFSSSEKGHIIHSIHALEMIRINCSKNGELPPRGLTQAHDICQVVMQNLVSDYEMMHYGDTDANVRVEWLKLYEASIVGL